MIEKVNSATEITHPVQKNNSKNLLGIFLSRIMYKIFCGFRKSGYGLTTSVFRNAICHKLITHEKESSFKLFHKLTCQTKNATSDRYQKLFLANCRFHTHKDTQKLKNRNSLYYLTAMVIFVGGSTYLSVLLYRLYCQTTGKGGQAVLEEAGEKIASMKSVKNRCITVNFNADVNSTMRWNFKPQQPYIKVSPGETALAFYTARNPTPTPITGVATYNVLPFEAGKYFNKIQCFCFEEQQLNPNEEVDMPVFFYLDPEYAEDPRLEYVNDIVLSYTFFEAKEGMQLPRPAFV
ncbi:cytochrome c oxidase assembly protein COX11, mitochondrial [Caerostris darwini]|uniref:Cytochrome c oxidase assembly protein COX11, mitochondrial n=1 Tax=Caerostris darwini TaxID=1538125 RepID=A0AAV4QMU8_9ARAC|nr:cytochrome c oxidase assembly protein COX11, mitochondrial [Caerostris darwini]